METRRRPIPVKPLGQSGFRFESPGAVLYIDPYLSDRVAELHGPELHRLRPPPLLPEQIADATWVLITHGHEDHCDPATLVPLAAVSPDARFLCPSEVVGVLVSFGISGARCAPAAERWYDLGAGTRVHPVPAAHPTVTRDTEGHLRAVGFVLEIEGRRIYHAGDTSVDAALLAAVTALGPLAVAFLPVNERNFYRDRRGILGNMTVREAFTFAAELGVEALVPIHWDLFAPNSVFRDELLLLYRLLSPPFRLLLEPTVV